MSIKIQYIKLYLCYFFEKKKMQSKITNKIQWAETLNPLNDISASIDSTLNLKDVFRKVDKLGDLWDSG